MYARGILFGKMKYELGDHSFVRCPELDLTADIEFKTKGWVSGTYNAIGGCIKRESTGEVLFELSGLWSEEMTIKNVQVSDPGGGEGMIMRQHLTANRLATKKCSLTPPPRNRAHHRSGLSASKKNGNRKGSGKQPLKPSKSETTSWRRMKKPKLRTVREKRQRPGRLKASTGDHGSSAASRDPTMWERISSGSSTPICTWEKPTNHNCKLTQFQRQHRYSRTANQTHHVHLSGASWPEV